MGENTDIADSIQTLAKITKKPEEQKFLDDLLIKISKEKMTPEEKILLLRIYEKYKSEITANQEKIQRSLDSLSEILNIDALKEEIKPLLLFHALEKNKTNQDYFVWKELELKTLDSHFANLINKLQIKKYNIGQIFWLKGKNDLEKGKELQKLIFPKKTGEKNIEENDRYELGACIMLIKILDYNRARIASNDLDRIKRKDSKENPLIQYFQDLDKKKTPEERDIYFMQISFSELMDIMVTERIRKSGDVGKKILQEGLSWLRKLPGFPEIEKIAPEESNNIIQDSNNAINDGVRELINESLTKLGMSQEEKATLDVDKVLKYLTQDAWYDTKTDIIIPDSMTTSEKKVITAILDQKNIDEQKWEIFNIDIHSLIDNPSLEKNFFDTWKAHATTQDILMLKSIMWGEDNYSGKENKIREYTLLLYMASFMHAHNKPKEVGILQGKVEKKALLDIWFLKDYLQKIRFESREAAIAYETISQLEDILTQFKNHIKENPLLLTFYVWIILTIAFRIWGALAILNLRKGWFRKFALVLEWGFPLLQWLDLRSIDQRVDNLERKMEKVRDPIQKSRIQKMLSAIKEKLGFRGADANEAKDRLDQIEEELNKLQTEWNQNENQETIREVNDVQRDLESLREKMRSNPDWMRDPLFRNEIALTAKRIESVLEVIETKLPAGHPERIKLEEMRKQFKTAPTADHINSICVHIEERIRPALEKIRAEKVAERKGK